MNTDAGLDAACLDDEWRGVFSPVWILGGGAGLMASSSKLVSEASGELRLALAFLKIDEGEDRDLAMKPSMEAGFAIPGKIALRVGQRAKEERWYRSGNYRQYSLSGSVR